MSILEKVRDRWIKFVTGMEPSPIHNRKVEYIEMALPAEVDTYDQKYDMIGDVVELLDNAIKIKKVSKPKSKSKTKSK